MWIIFSVSHVLNSLYIFVMSAVFQVNKQFLVPGNGVQAGPRRDTVGSVSDDDSKMIICEDRPQEANTDPSSTKAGKCVGKAARDPRTNGLAFLFYQFVTVFHISSHCQNSDLGLI